MIVEHKSETAFQVLDRNARSLVKDLHQPKPTLYYADLLASALVGWSAFAGAALLPFLSWPMLLCSAVAVFALYRGLCFLHEISHLKRRALPGFETLWNILFGFPLLMPTFVYCGVHQSHHKLSTYGTLQDPEYMAFARSGGMTLVFALESFLIPIVLVIRFIPVSALGLLSSRIQLWLVRHASSMTMNLKYRREATGELIRTVRRQSAVILLGGTVLIGCGAMGFLPWRLFGTWLLVSAVASFVNTMRTLGAHAYESAGAPLDREGQLLDSIDTPGAPWTELWAPVGLRYHALHHYFPGIPYHNLAEAYRRITQAHARVYRRSTSRSLPHSLHTLVRKGFSKPV
jgi:fatty acid desaturase